LTNLKLTSRRSALVIALFTIGLFFLALPFFRPVEVPFLFLFIGRLHPLILHFPIVLIILALLFEVAGRYYRLKTGENTVLVVLIAAALSAFVSITAGFFLFASGDYSGNLMERHFWAGAITGTAIFVTLGLFYIYRGTTRFYYLYFAALLISNAVVGLASHLGGSITHGADYLTEHLQYVLHAFDTEKAAKRETEMLVYEDMIAPVFEAKCMSCHNDQRAKGDFSMSTFQQLVKGGESDHPSITSGKPEESEVYKRVVLPEDHKDRMPPEGKTPLKDSEVALLKFWIESGATEKLKVEEARKVDTIGPVITALLPELAKYRRKAQIEHLKLAALESELRELASRLDVTIRPDSLSDENLFTIAMKFPPAPFSNEQFRELSPYFEVFSKISLISSGIDDAGLYYIGQMVNLRELYLQKTKVDGSGIVFLQNLPKLEVLNLSFTKTDDKAALDLLKMHSLREVYLYRTNTTMQVVEALRKYKPGVRFLLEEGPYF
jgi:uncharacterized membrane protein